MNFLQLCLCRRIWNERFRLRWRRRMWSWNPHLFRKLLILSQHSWFIHLSMSGELHKVMSGEYLHNSQNSKGQTCRGPQKSISFWWKDFVVVLKKFQNDNYWFEVEILQHFMQLIKLSWVARKAFAGSMQPAGRMLCRPVPVYLSDTLPLHFYQVW